jgi:ABC-type phosphate transport system permease subunit
MNRATALIVSILLTALGVGMLHFCEGTSFLHHRNWAIRQGIPEPSFTMWIAGTLATVVGALWLGFMIGRGRRRA